MHTYIYAYIYMHTYIYAYIYMHTYMHTYIRIIYTDMHTYINIYNVQLNMNVLCIQIYTVRVNIYLQLCSCIMRILFMDIMYIVYVDICMHIYFTALFMYNVDIKT